MFEKIGWVCIGFFSVMLIGLTLGNMDKDQSVGTITGDSTSSSEGDSTRSGEGDSDVELWEKNRNSAKNLCIDVMLSIRRGERKAPFDEEHFKRYVPKTKVGIEKSCDCMSNHMVLLMGDLVSKKGVAKVAGEFPNSVKVTAMSLSLRSPYTTWCTVSNGSDPVFF